MPAYKDSKTGKWYTSFYYTNWNGVREKKMKRGFETKKAALEWERDFLMKSQANLDMRFDSFVELYIEDLQHRIKENTFKTKNSVINSKIIPFFKNKKLSEITVKDVIKWQNELLAYEDEDGDPFSQTYLKQMHNQLTAIFNHAVRYYDLKENPATKAGPIGEKEAGEIVFWTKEEYLKFAETLMHKPKSYYAFEILYWCGIRMGELLALTPEDFDFEKGILRINKSYQRIDKRDVITPPKTKKSNRIIKMPELLCEEVKEYINMLYGIKPTDRIFLISKSFLHHEMTRGSEAAGVKRIKVHALRHSHVSLLIDMGFSAVAIAARVGHESIDITYRYAHLFPTTQTEMADKLSTIRKGDEENVKENCNRIQTFNYPYVSAWRSRGSSHVL